MPLGSSGSLQTSHSDCGFEFGFQGNNIIPGFSFSVGDVGALWRCVPLSFNRTAVVINKCVVIKYLDKKSTERGS